MSKKSVVVTYKNLHPSEETKGFVESVIDEIYHELPRGSQVKASFTAKDDSVKAVLQAGSRGKVFFATAVSTSIHEIVTALLAQMRRRLEKYKGKNHRRLSIKDLTKNEKYFSDSLNISGSVSSEAAS